MTNFSEVLVSSDIRASRDLMFYNVLLQKAPEQFQAYAFRDIEMAALQALSRRSKEELSLMFLTVLTLNKLFLSM